MGLAEEHKIADKELGAAINALEERANAGKSGNFELRSGEITRNDVSRMEEGKRYVDVKNKRIVIKIGSKLYKSDLDEL